MKKFFLFIFLFSFCFFLNSCFFSKQSTNNYSINTKESINNKDCYNTPELNQKIIRYVKSKIGQKVDRGECWDLAAKSLDLIDAKWDGMYKYGREVFYLTDCIFPGDIIQFEGVKIKYQKGEGTYTEIMQHHTAIIYEVYGTGDFRIAHQNTGFSGRKVGLSSLNLRNIIKGRFMIYRPIIN